ncbi:VOC family protein [Fimbriiglobus ruber]|uniref:Putative DNA binding 3-demethylubiquinone-9 3-methyltransferase domain protein n=1 Tax=Fimbriiglobus ruber TaxID=1908690 RepID=A0A225D7N3_9BACT|nr:VOC family protein [Fimbriiglobus ruber]OWK37571.1 putative DNA binding 3-demethylubiquinone-9 3-methyltransferase domain protein [Fimbriiglobus ruber]
MTGTAITPYLFFGGRCDEAIAFYRAALGAEVEMLMRYDESPEPAPPGMLQAGFEKKVMHASLNVRGVRLMASDGCDDKSKFDGFQLAFTVPTEADARQAFDALVDGGSVQMPLTKTFWSPCFGMATDRFGVRWMVMVPGPTG